ncbi:hypothetical protein RHO12_01895 [Orbus sturtevantii]|uniref:ABC-three component system middle component 6 n=1 Tax=Orbus sturtevantii TaxID=3074109 RepID=UPI00370D93E0
MLLPNDTHPEETVYFNAIFVIRVLNESGEQHVMEVYSQTKKIRNMSVSMFSLCLDWLYLLNFLYIDSEGWVKRCS